MSELRWILLAIGAMVLLVVWWHGGLKSRRRVPMDENLIDAARDDEPPELTDVLESGLDLDEIEALGRSLQRQVIDSGEPAQVTSDGDMILVIHVARIADPISSTNLFPALDDAGLTYGQMDIFHYELEDGREAFSAANMVEPGTFDPINLDEGIRTPGVTLFAVLPGPLMASETLDRMLVCARKLARLLDADVLDEGRGAMSKQTENALRERVVAFDARHP